ncbi:MAG: DUF222 domain-containing protein, partial [Streptosporangiaceae bacterium]
FWLITLPLMWDTVQVGVIYIGIQALDMFTLVNTMSAAAGDGRTMDQRRADALVDLLTGRHGLSSPLARAAGASPAASASPGAPTDPTDGADAGNADPGNADPGNADAGSAATGSAAHVGVPAPRARAHVTLAATTLLGLDDAPGELAGYGPIPATVARAIAADATWRLAFTDPATATLAGLSRRTYAPGVVLGEFIRARDVTCRFPVCRQPATRCDIDHTTAYPDGATEPCNLACLCRHHHRLKQ